MKREDLLQLTTHGESETLECKTSTAELDSGLQSVCGILNSGSPGFVFFGITDGGELRGQEIGDQTLERVANAVRRIEPMADISISSVSLENGRAVVSVECPASERTHTYGGIPYQRLGRTTSRMPSERYRQRIVDEAHRSDSWERRPATGFTIDDLDQNQIVMTVEEAIRRQRLTDPLTRNIEALLLGLGVLQHGQILNAGMVLFGKADRLRGSYPQCLLRLARFQGVTKSNFLDNRQFAGNAFDLLLGRNNSGSIICQSRAESFRTRSYESTNRFIQQRHFGKQWRTRFATVTTAPSAEALIWRSTTIGWRSPAPDRYGSA